jgi:RNA polymerase sigma factor (sigma-70 family)
VLRLVASIAGRCRAAPETHHAPPATAARWCDHAGSPAAFVTTVTTRLAADQLRSARARRKQYVGEWLPEPILTDKLDDPERQAEMADSISVAMPVLLESLSPERRAGFLLHDVFDYRYEEIARIVSKSEDNVRQLATRARRHVAQRRPVSRPRKSTAMSSQAARQHRAPPWAAWRDIHRRHYCRIRRRADSRAVQRRPFGGDRSAAQASRARLRNRVRRPRRADCWLRERQTAGDDPQLLVSHLRSQSVDGGQRASARRAVRKQWSTEPYWPCPGNSSGHERCTSEGPLQV